MINVQVCVFCYFYHGFFLVLRWSIDLYQLLYSVVIAGEFLFAWWNGIAHASGLWDSGSTVGGCQSDWPFRLFLGRWMDRQRDRDLHSRQHDICRCEKLPQAFRRDRWCLGLSRDGRSCVELRLSLVFFIFCINFIWRPALFFSQFFPIFSLPTIFFWCWLRIFSIIWRGMCFSTCHSGFDFYLYPFMARSFQRSKQITHFFRAIFLFFPFFSSRLACLIWCIYIWWCAVYFIRWREKRIMTVFKSPERYGVCFCVLKKSLICFCMGENFKKVESEYTAGMSKMRKYSLSGPKYSDSLILYYHDLTIMTRVRVIVRPWTWYYVLLLMLCGRWTKIYATSIGN